MWNPFDRKLYRETTAEIIKKTIYDNPYLLYKPYPRQLWPIFEITEPIRDKKPHTILVGGGGFGGKTYLGSMLAAQYLQFPGYQCLVTRKNRKELIGPNSIWRNLKEWLTRPELGPLRLDPRTDINKSELVMTAPSGATIWFRYFDEEESKEKLQSESYDREIHDEAPQLKPRVLKFSYRSLRHGNSTIKIPLAMILLGNPAADDKENSTQYVTEKYVDGPNSYYWMDWRHNIHIDPEVYGLTLDELDFIDIQYQKHGNWHYRPAKGDLFPEKVLRKSVIQSLPAVQIVRNIRGMDIATSGSGDYVALVKWLMDNRGHKYVPCVVREQTQFPEDLLCEVIEKDNPRWEEGIFETEYYLEKGIADAGELAKRYMEGVLSDYIEKGLYIDFIPPIKNKFTRARPMALSWKNGEVSIIDQANILGKIWVPDFIDEYKDFGPDDKEYDHDDQVDGGSVGYNKLESGGNPFTDSKKRYEAAKKAVDKRTHRLPFTRR